MISKINDMNSTLFSYIKQEDTFFYTLVYDKKNEQLFEDRGEIKIGSSYQCDFLPEVIDPSQDRRRSEELEELVWSPEHDLEDKVIDQFLVLARSVGTFARAVDEASTLKQPSLHMSAAAASRDICDTMLALCAAAIPRNAVAAFLAATSPPGTWGAMAPMGIPAVPSTLPGGGGLGAG